MDNIKSKTCVNSALFLISFSIFLYQVCLLRIISISDYYHFAFLIVSIALLGFGISGSFLYFFTDKLKNSNLAMLVFSLLFTVSIFASYILINLIPFDSFKIAWELKQIFYLFAYYFSLLLPFFFGGSFIGYVFYKEKNPRITYFFNLTGSAAGAIAFIFLVELTGKTGVLMISITFGLAAVFLVMMKRYFKIFTALTAIFVISALFLLIFFPSLFEVRMSPYKSLPAILRMPQSEVIYSRENSISRIDVVQSPGIKSFPGLSLKYQQIPPPQTGITIDGDNLSPITYVNGKNIKEFEFLEYMPAAVIFSTLYFTGRYADKDMNNQYLAEDILVIEPGGGLDVLAAVYFSTKANPGSNNKIIENKDKPQNGISQPSEQDKTSGAQDKVFTITALQNNSLITELFKNNEIKNGYFKDYSGQLYNMEGVSLIEESGRNYINSILKKTGFSNMKSYAENDAGINAANNSRNGDNRKFGLIILSLSDSYRSVSSGAYSLNENYLYTVESFEEMMEALDNNGVLAITRWVQIPPSEEIKVISTLAESAQKLNVKNLSDKIFAFRSWSTATVLFKKSGFSQEETYFLKEKLKDLNYDLIYAKGIQQKDTNIYNQLSSTTHYKYFKKIIEEKPEKRNNIYNDYYFNIRPATDNRPYFYDFFKFRQIPEIIKYFGKTTQPFGGGGYIIITAALLIAIILSITLVIFPLRLRKISISLKADYKYLIYFTLLGFAFFFIELPFIQKFILVLGKPAYSLSITLFALLLSAGAGSFISSKKKINLIYPVAVIVLYTFIFIFFWKEIQDFLIIRPLWQRFLFTILIILPAGFFMGIPFPAGIEKAKIKRSQIIPWLWAINGCSSVIASIAAVMISIHLGFLVVIAISAVLYVAALVIYKFI